MKECSKCNELKHPSLFNFNRCKACIALEAKARYQKNKEHILRVSQDRYFKNKPKRTKQIAEWRAANKEKTRKHNNAYSRRNPHKVAAKQAKRRAAKFNATPSWLTKENLRQIEDFYKQRVEVSKRTGIEHHVDHIIPLQGENVCGLHVNMPCQVIDKAENDCCAP